MAARADPVNGEPLAAEVTRSASPWLGVLPIALSWLASTTWRSLCALAPSAFHDPELDDGRD